MFEYCYPLGFDQDITFNNVVLLNVYYRNGGYIEGKETILLRKDGDLPLDLGRRRVFCDPRIELKVRVTAKGGSGEDAWAELEITYQNRLLLHHHHHHHRLLLHLQYARPRR